MDEVLIRRAAACACAALGLAWGASAHAQQLQDPTRPPATLSAPPAAPGAAGASAGPQLQTILIGRAAGGRQLAVIDGQTVQVGDTFHGARVTRIGDNEVVLARGSERQILRLYAQDAANGMTPAARMPGR